MYAVQAEVADVSESVTYLPSEMIDFEWLTVCDIPQLESDQQELREARLVERLVGTRYRNTRIMKWLPGGEGQVVR